MTKKVTLKRYHYSNHGILGALFIDNKEFCKTAERPWLENKRNVSCIPAGEYYMEPSYSPRFNKDLFELKNVPDRSEILIHVGNTYKDSEGCILVGKNYYYLREVIGVSDSVYTYDILFPKLTKMIEPPETGLALKIVGQYYSY